MNSQKLAATPKRHNSVSFTNSSTLSAECQNRTKWRRYSSNLRPNCHRHGSVMSLVMRHKAKNGGTITTSSSRGAEKEGIFRRPSAVLPSLPMAILQAMINPTLKNPFGTMSLPSLDDGSTFSTVCSSSASTTDAHAFEKASECQMGIDSSTSHTFWPSPSPWRCSQLVEEMEVYNFGGTINGHPFIWHPKGTLQKERLEKGCANGNGAILCAEGNTQAHLLSLVAPSDKRVVNVGRSTGDEAIGSGDCHRLFSHNPNNLNPYQ